MNTEEQMLLPEGTVTPCNSLCNNFVVPLGDKLHEKLLVQNPLETCEKFEVA